MERPWRRIPFVQWHSSAGCCLECQASRRSCGSRPWGNPWCWLLFRGSNASAVLRAVSCAVVSIVHLRHLLGLSQEIWLILPVVICLFQGLSHASVRVLGVYLERSVYGSLNGLLSTQRRMCICHPNGITLLTAKLIPVRRTSYLSNSGVTSGLLHCGARCASPKQKPTPFFGSYYC